MAWAYLDKKAAVAEALKDFSAMEYIIENTAGDISEIRTGMSSLPPPILSDMPKGAPDPHGGEERLAAQIDEIDVLKERYRRALEYMEWFRPAWENLSEEERYVLTEFYREDGNGQTGSVYNICDRFHIERSSAYNRKNRALARLSLMLYGK
jgi:hypothetical protein